MNQNIHEIFVTALLKSIWPRDQVTPCLGVAVEKVWESNKALIMQAQQAICPDAQIDPEQTEMPSPFAFIWRTDKHGNPIRIRPDLKTPTYTLPEDIRTKTHFLFPGESGRTTRELLAELQERLKRFSSTETLPENKLFASSEALLSLIRFYTSAIAVNSHVSVFDYARLSAAVAVCMSHNKGIENPLLFVKADFSGIQEFIFDTESKGAAKALKARSLRIQAMAFMAADYLLKELELSPANVLYNGGGTFFMLVPQAQKEKLKVCRKHIYERPLELHEGDVLSIPESIQVFLGYTPIMASDFQAGFAAKWQALEEAVNEQRIHPFEVAEQGEALHEALFKPLPPYNFTLRRKAEKAYFKEITKGEREFVDGERVGDISKFNGFVIEKLQDENEKAVWQSVYEVKLERENEGDPEGHKTIPEMYSGFYRRFRLRPEAESCRVLINTPQLMLKSWEGNESIPKPVTYLVKDLPKWDPELLVENRDVIKDYVENNNDLEKEEKEPHKNHIISFGYLAAFAKKRTGTAKLGILKMDIDNLGRVFRSQIRDGKGESSIMHSAAVSRAMEWFFEGHLNSLLDMKLSEWFTQTYSEDLEKLSIYHTLIDSAGKTFRDNIYVIFSGGDDCMMVGGWDLIMEFARLVRKEFDRFTGGTLTLSAGIIMVGPKFPVSRFAVLAEEALSQAKSFPDAEKPTKNAISVFDEVLSWQDFDTALALKNTLYFLLTKKEERESRALLWKVHKSISGYTQILRQIQWGKKIELPRLWRLNYYLRDVKEVNQDIVQTDIVQLYERLFKGSLKWKKADQDAGKIYASPSLIAVGVRWAEFLSKNAEKIQQNESDTPASQ